MTLPMDYHVVGVAPSGAALSEVKMAEPVELVETTGLAERMEAVALRNRA